MNSRLLFAGSAVGIAVVSFAATKAEPWVPTSTITFAGMILLRATPIWKFVPLWVPLLFIFWCWPLTRSSKWLPKRSVVLAAGVTLLTLFCFTETAFALRYHGEGYVAFAVLGNTIGVALAAATALMYWRTPRPGRGYLFHLGLFLWLATYAIPYFGEYP